MKQRRGKQRDTTQETLEQLEQLQKRMKKLEKRNRNDPAPTWPPTTTFGTSYLQ